MYLDSILESADNVGDVISAEVENNLKFHLHMDYLVLF